MFSFYDRVPRCILEKYQLMLTAVFTVLFSLVCLLLCIPFLQNVWFSLAQGDSFVYTLVFFAIAVALEFTSRRFLGRVGQIRNLTYLQLAGWMLGEVTCISAIYAVFSMEALRAGFLDPTAVNPDKLFFGSFLFNLITIGAPFIMAVQYFLLQDRDNTIRLMNYGNVVSDVDVPAGEEKRITLFDNSGVLKFSINSENLYFIESDDNYVKVWYMDGSGHMKQYMLRCRLKTIEESFVDSDLVRCHRKYVVNISKIKILSSEKDGYFIDLDIDSVDPIPVSKTYEENLLSRFNSR